MNAAKSGLRSCRPLPAGTPALSPARIDADLAQLPGRGHRDGVIGKTFSFASYPGTIAFANAVAEIAQREDHHPDMPVGCDKCRVASHTRCVGGVSENDFICAAKIEAL